MLGGGEPGEIATSAFDTRGFPPRGPQSWLKDRFRLLGTILSAPVRYRGHRDAPETGIAIYDPGSESASVRQLREYWLDKYFAERGTFVDRRLTPKALGLRSKMRSASWWWRGVLLGLLGLLDFSDNRLAWLAATILDVRAYARIDSSIERAYVFAMYDRRSYAMVTYLHSHTAVDVVPVFQNIPLYRNCRCFHLPIPVELTSRVNLEEARYFAEQGTFLATEFRHHGPEYVMDIDEAVVDAPQVDIGYFSSGEWARRDGLYQVTDPDVVRSGALRGNPYDEAATTILDGLARYAREHDLTLRIYPHPFERRLMREHSIVPPYAALEDGRNVEIDRSEDESSRRRIYEPAAAVSLQSSIIWERLELGLDCSFMYEFADRERNVFLREALGAYSANIFSSPEELETKLADCERT